MLQIAFGQSKYVIDNLSENVKRGLREKLRKGGWPGVAPTGYLNDKVNKTIVIDHKRAPKIKKLFERYATGDYSIYDIRNFSRSLGLVSRNGKELSVSNIQKILQNPFYYSMMMFKGELYEGAHEPIIPRQLFAKAQDVMNNRSKPKSGTDYDWDFLGLFTCGECGRSITAEQQKKTYQNGTSQVFRYYRCTKKGTNCSQPYLREEQLVEQINSLLQKVALKDDWADKMLKQLQKDERKESQSSFAFAQNLKDQLESVESKLDKLLDMQLDGLLATEEYQAKKEKLLNKKLALQEKIKDFERKGNNWLGPLREWILEANQAEKIALTENFSRRRNFLKKIGSNFLL